ncbi:MAG: hypothetical protein LBU36_01595 [Clostridiales bacterium]|jgi:uncharacterized FAD-dependent dehydrogenase|nr:hypothetical protein [Clostridiales bacterium]
MIRLTDLRFPAEGGAPQPPRIIKKAARLLKIRPADIKSAVIRRKSIDARDKGNVLYVVTADIELLLPEKDGFFRLRGASRPPEPPEFIIKKAAAGRTRPVIAGAGPAGLFCALALGRAGLAPIILERGRDADARARDVARFFETGELDPESNVQFGEGGAGTFSDGKLTCGTNNPLIPFVLRTFADFGAPGEVLTDAKPHIGTDNLTVIVKNIRREIERLGGEIRFRNKFTRLELLRGRVAGVYALEEPGGEYFIETDAFVLAAGHSARDTARTLRAQGAEMAAKPFSAGFRIEHRREYIDRLMYGRFAGKLPAADYKLSARLRDGRGAYTFCMCPGGEVIAAASEAGGLCVNGMSRFARASENSNSAVLISLAPADFVREGPLDGLDFARKLEETAFRAGGGDFLAPAARLGDFLARRDCAGFGEVTPSYKPGAVPVNFYDFFDGKFLDAAAEAILAMDAKAPGFAFPEAALTGVETRSSSPVTILRGAGRQSSLGGLFPCGEGAGYAGGIVSSAIDGLRTAEAVAALIGGG